MFKKTEVGEHLPDNGRVLITCKNGKVTALRNIYDDEHIATINSLIEMAKLSGYTVVEKDKTRL